MSSLKYASLISSSLAFSAIGIKATPGVFIVSETHSDDYSVLAISTIKGGSDSLGLAFISVSVSVSLFTFSVATSFYLAAKIGVKSPEV